MICSVLSSVLHGIDAAIINVEADISPGLPAFDMVGCLGSEVKEAKERVKTAIRNSGFSLPPAKITINISPADIKKEGGSFDLSVAAALLGAVGVILGENIRNTLFLGELSLDGTVRAVKGVLPSVLLAHKQGIKRCFVPVNNAKEGAIVKGIEVIGISSLKQLVEILNNSQTAQPEYTDVDKIICEAAKISDAGNGDFKDIYGQKGLKRAAEIAVAGMHNLLIIGPPGAGKTMVSKRITSILPPMTLDECLEVTSIYSIAENINSLITKRPFRSPHHSITPAAMSGGGRNPTPGEISLAHKGVLFLDEFVEFKPQAIETLRQPLEDGKILISRNNGNYTFPADVMLVAAMNPCKCGFYPDRTRCRCSEREIIRYYNRISGPIIDRIDVCVEAPRLKLTEINEESSKIEDSYTIRKRIENSFEIQKDRYKGSPYTFNSQLTTKDTKKYCHLGRTEKEFLDEIFEKLNLSARAYYKIMRVARSIADLEEKNEIELKHISEAAACRPIEKKGGIRLDEE